MNDTKHDHHEHHPAPTATAQPDSHSHQHHHVHEANLKPQHGHAHADPDAHSSHGADPMGHGGEHHGHGAMHEGHADMMRNRFFVVLPLTLIVVLYSEMVQAWLGFTMPQFPGSSLIAPVLGSFIFFYGGLPFLSMARQELKGRQPGMMTLISIAIIAAYVYSMAIFFFPTGDPDAMPGMVMSTPTMDFFWELATLIAVMLLGHWIELRSVGQAQGALKELARLLPDSAERLLPGGETETVPIDELRVGDRLLIRPGASIPADGVVVEGESKVNEAMITGESRPLSKSTGSEVIGGTVNGSGSLRIEVSQVGDKTALAGIMRLVRDAQNSTSRAQTLAQRAAFYLTLIAIGAGIVTLVGWLVITGSVSQAVKNMVTVLVIACPHALGLAVPLVVSISTTLSARNGLLVRQRLALERARDLDAVIFDKTGTLTTGEQGVFRVAVSGIDEKRALEIAAGLEGDSEHMIAQAVRSYARDRGVAPAPVRGFESLPGKGVRARVEDVVYYVGGPRMLEQLGLTLPDALTDDRIAAETAGQSVIYLATEDSVLALFAIADVIREESRQAVQTLHDLGIEVAMLTGDSEAVAQSVARELKIDTVFAQVLPEHKAEKVRTLQAQGKKVAMVGDGVNDAPALVTADVGIAIGAGTDVAIESAGIILVRSNPLDIVRIVRLSRATYRKMIQNLIWATGYNVIAIPLAMGVLAPFGVVLDPAIGAVFMSLSTIVVAFNAQLLRRLDLSAG